MSPDPISAARTGVERLADVVTMPIRATNEAVTSSARSMAAWQPGEPDAWGRDPEFVGAMWTLSQLRWQVTVAGHERLPKRAGGLIVVNARKFALTPVYTALAVGGSIGRPVRFIGRPDATPLGPFLQRLGALQTRPDELHGALRAGELVVMGAGHRLRPRQVGRVDHALVGAAVEAGVKVFPAAAGSSTNRRAARVRIGAHVAPSTKRRGPLTELELADDVNAAIVEMLDTFGGTQTGTPLDWLPFSSMGGGG